MSTRHREQACAKLTRSLRILGRRNDGYHLIRAEMVSLDLTDELDITDGDRLEVIDDVAWSGGPATRGSSPVVVPADESNLVSRALSVVGRTAAVRLIKRIPAGAGLGGGSADAAAILRWAGRGDSESAVRVGSDVPFCVTGGRAVVSGIGEIVERLPFVEASFLTVTPGFGVSTRKVYAAWDELGGPTGEGTNDLETAAILAEPRLASWRSLVEAVAGRPPSLAGSGSTWWLEVSDPASAGEAEALRAMLAGEVERSGTRALVTLCRTAEQAEGITTG
jgi:4-diphosphocytidyl-2-C-methyl-D-erythritol kinase